MSIYEEELSKRLRVASSFNSHFSNVISGMNHEVSPWLGSVANANSRLEKMIEEIGDCDTEEERILLLDKCLAKVRKIQYAIEQATSVLSLMSRDVKRLQNYSLSNTRLSDTVSAWSQITLVDQLVKSTISKSNLSIDYKSLEFDVEHSPMLLSQVILNLAKNSIEHNPHMLEDLQITIKGLKNKKEFIYEDNGCGIEPEMLNRIFSPGITSKNEASTSHGLGLSACMDYCIAMNASIWAESERDNFARFIIKFEHSYEENCDENTEQKQFCNLKALKDLYQTRKEEIKVRGDNLW